MSNLPKKEKCPYGICDGSGRVSNMFNDETDCPHVEAEKEVNKGEMQFELARGN